MDLSLARVPTPRTPVPDDQVLVTGDIREDWTFSTAHLDAHAREPVNVQYRTTRVTEVHCVQGVPLHDVLSRVVLRLDGTGKMDELSFVVIATSKDGFRVALSWAEVDPEFGSCAALLATRYNGRRLTRPTLVTPRDGRSSRYVRDLACLEISRVTTRATTGT
ncbi:molybdopterin-binding protein [Lentzea sp. NBRC 102530]|uniref:molybdopterin-binding protein n=1 Tax=Lentzea sp. NBRC 102530 TaxID=3032201 RepID=UPI002552FEC0|nr:molybdopterin-binding protein [Lentzea sp. NBRC 102530]